jgi:MFS transporter, DHA3 family, macrolide efflux protein
MQTFIIIWLGQMVSTIGSYMTVFALTIWVWQLTGSSTALILVGFFAQLPRLVITPIAGMLVDRFPRKHLMLLGDIVALLCTLAIAGLYFAQQLQIWHLYVAVTFYGGFGQLQTLAYSASIALLVPKEQFTRAESMGAAVSYSTAIFSPALAGNLYPIIGLKGIFAIDLLTFAASLLTLAIVQIPQPPHSEATDTEGDPLWQKLTFGFRYIWQRPGLMAMVIAFTLFAIPNDINKALYSPMILARTGGDAQILGNVTTAAGLGGVLGGVGLSLWGGFGHRIHGMLLGFIGSGAFKVVLGLGQTPNLWMGAHFLASLHIPLFYSSSNAIWYAKVPSHLQGRVLAADQLIGITISAIVPLGAGILADRLFEPLMRSSNPVSDLFSPWFGMGDGAGLTLLYTCTAFMMLVVGIGGYAIPTLRNVETILPDGDELEQGKGG